MLVSWFAKMQVENLIGNLLALFGTEVPLKYAHNRFLVHVNPFLYFFVK